MKNKNSFSFRRTAQVLFLAMLVIPYFSTCKKDPNKEPDPPKSDQKEITNLKVRAGTDFTPVLQSDGKTWQFTVDFDFDQELLKEATVTFTISRGAVSSPVTGATLDLRSPKDIIVTAEDESKFTYTIEKVDEISSDAAFTSFELTVGGQKFTGNIDNENSKVTFPAQFPFSMTEALAAAVPTFEVSHGATASPLSGVEQNFTSPVVYTITAQDQTQRQWTVETEIGTESSGAFFTSFTLTVAGEPYTGIIDLDNSKVTFDQFPNSKRGALSAAVPAFELAPGATASPLSGVAQDFTSPVEYTITAQDQTTTRKWTIKVDIASPLTEIPGLVGLWEFNDPANLLKASIGKDLVSHVVPDEDYYNTIGIPSTEGIRPISGINDNDGAIEKDLGYMFLCDHGIPASEGTPGLVSEWTIMYDFKIPTSAGVGAYQAVLQTGYDNDTQYNLGVGIKDSWNIAILPSGNYGARNEDALQFEKWYRIVMTVYTEPRVRVVLDGVNQISIANGADNDQYKLDARGIWFFGDNNRENGPMHISTIAIFNRSFTLPEIQELF